VYPGGNDIWAVSSTVSFNAIQRLQNNTWDVWSGSPLEGDARSISGTSATDVWIPGSNMVHYDGVEWTDVPFNGVGARVVWAYSETDAWAGAQDEFHHWDGSTWQLHTNLNASGEIDHMWGSGPNDIWATRDVISGNQAGFLYHYDGNAWTAYNFIEPLNGSVYRSLWGLSNDQIWLGAFNGVYHIFDGFGWYKPDNNESIEAIWGADLQEVWKVGSTIDRWNPMTEEFDLEDNPDGSLWDIWGASADNIWAVGEDHLIMRYDGNAWAEYNGPIVEEMRWVDESMYSVWGTTEGFFAAGDNGLILQRP
jgi:hypothetical protein